MLWLLYLIPKNHLSRLIGCLVRVRRPAFLVKLSVRIFANFYKLNMHEAEYELDCYPCIAQLFTRNLKKDARPIASQPVCPVDGVLRSIDNINQGSLIQVKGINYSLEQLLGTREYLHRLSNGTTANFYLTPRDYHHIHAPVSGKVVAVTHIPGYLWPVNDWSLNNISNLFCINERVVVYLQSDFGLCAVVMVGATNVGQIELSFTSIKTNQVNSQHKPIAVSIDSNIHLEVGDRLGTFLMGSSVILIMESQVNSFLLSAGQRVQYGERLFASNLH